jgi:hypothetical protein
MRFGTKILAVHAPEASREFGGLFCPDFNPVLNCNCPELGFAFTDKPVKPRICLCLGQRCPFMAHQDESSSRFFRKKVGAGLA